MKDLMGCLEKYKPVMAMAVLQCIYAALSLTTAAALTQGLSPRVFIVYRQAIATLFIAPIAYFVERREPSGIGKKSFCMIFLAALIGVTMNQNFYFQGLFLSSASMATAMTNVVPAVTFLMAASIGLEKIDYRSTRSMTTVLGTIICVAGAVTMALFKGPKLLHSIFYSGAENWMMGCLLLLGSTCCWSFWLIWQVPMSNCFPHHLSLSAWMCFLATLQSATLTFFLEPDSSSWKLNSSYELLCCLYSGIVGSGVTFYVQAWCISKRGPLFSAMFNPLCTVIVTILGCLILHEQLYTGSLAGGIAVVAGLYVVLWGKAKDLSYKGEVKPMDDSTKTKGLLNESLHSCKIDMKEPLLGEKLAGLEKSEMNN